MGVSRSCKAGRRQGLKLAQNHPKELFGEQVFFSGSPAAKQREGRAHESRGRNRAFHRGFAVANAGWDDGALDGESSE
jgi:hypothetical protein